MKLLRKSNSGRPELDTRAVLCLALLAPLLLSGCAFFFGSHDEAPCQPVKNVIFRLTAAPDAVEIRLEGDYFPAHNWDVVAEAEGKAGGDVTIKIQGVREPQEPHGSAAPASARLVVPRDADAKPGPWALNFKLAIKGEAEKVDAYTVEHVAGGWKLSKPQGDFTRFEKQGSF